MQSKKTKKMKFTKNKYLTLFFSIVVLLALTRCIFPSVAEDKSPTSSIATDSIQGSLSDSVQGTNNNVQGSNNNVQETNNNSLQDPQNSSPTLAANATIDDKLSIFYDKDGKEIRNRIYSVPHFGETFPDSNNVQLEAAKLYGVSPVVDRQDAERRKKELVCVSASPYYTVDKLRSSIPYLVPRAAILLNDIGRNFFDSLQIKGVPLHKFIITSVLRSREDVNKLRGHNHNATQNSCHLYGTTFDICYNRYTTVSDPDASPRRAVRNDTLKWVLSEVLRDMRESKRCYIKYEVKQGCFHITVR